MIKNNFLKYIIILLFYSNYINANNNILEQADLYFEKNEIQKAKILYDSIIYNYELYNDNLLIKLAFIEDQLGNYEKSIFYLKKLKVNSGDERVESFLKEIVNENKLENYENSDFDNFILIFSSYKFYLICLLLFSVCILCSINGFYFFKKRKLVAIKPIFIMLLIILISININGEKEGIIQFDDVFVMNDPSSGADLHSILKRGEKVNIIGEDKIWYEIKIGKESKFIRKKNLLVID